MKGKFIKKLVAYALTVAMVAATPMTAFASEFADNFWYADGSDEDGGNHENDGGPSGTGTVTVSETATTNLSQYDIAKIEIDPSSVVLDLDKQKTETLKVKVKNTSGAEITGADAEAIYSQIEWTTSNYSIVRPKVVNSKGRQNCEITGYKGGYAVITAGINTSGTSGRDKEYDYVAKCLVMVKKTPKSISMKLPNNNELYAGHTYDLNDYVTFDEDAFDAVDFTVAVNATPAKFSSYVTWSKDGVLSVDKKLKKFKSGESITLDITATCKNATTVSTVVQGVKVTPGVPATGLSFDASSKTAAKEYDIAKKEYEGTGSNAKKKATPDLPAIKVTAKTASGTTTDDITWSTSDSKVVRILPVDDKTPMNGKTENLASPSNDRQIKFQGMSVGKATITATSTSGKTAKLNVKVTASLLYIESAEVEGGVTYTGKATPIVVKRVPAQNQSKLKIEGLKGKKGLKAKAAITPILTPDANVSKISGASGDSAKVTGLTVMSANKKESGAGSATISEVTIKQSNVKLFAKDGALRGNSHIIKDKKTENFNLGRTITYVANIEKATAPSDMVEAAKTVSWESSKETVAKVTGQGKIQIVGTGSAKITVASVEDMKIKKQSFTIKSTPKCEEIVLKSNLVTVDKAKLKKDKNVTINVKQQLPKKAADNITWYTIDENNEIVPMSDTANSPIVAAKTNNKKCTVTVKASAAANSVIRVVAVSSVDNRVQAEAKIVVK